jgi:hypothetical protein
MTSKILLLLATVFLTTASPAEAQQPKKVPRIGIVGGSQDANNPRSGSNVLRQGLRDLGYVEGKNILIELRSSEGKPERTVTFFFMSSPVKNGSEDYEVKISFLATDNCLADYCLSSSITPTPSRLVT